MFIKTDEALNDYLANLGAMPLEDIVAVAETHSIEKFMLQPLVRTIEGSSQTFLALRNIAVKESMRGQGHFKNVLQHLLNSGHPLLMDDVVNAQLESYLQSKGWSQLKTQKYGDNITSYYKMN